MLTFTLRREHKEQNKHQVLFIRTVIIVILLAYWLSRLINLTLLPVFVDEAIMFHYARHVPNWPSPLELPAIDSKWFHVWLLHLALPLTSDNVLWFGRFLSVIAGLLACWSCYRFGKQVAGQSVGLLSATLYVLSPFSLWNDRLVAGDSLTGTLFLLSWSTALKLINPESTTLDAMLLGLSIGLASLTKAVNTMALSIPIICLLVCRAKYAKRTRRLVLLAYLPAFLLSSPVLTSLPYHATLIERHTVVGTSLSATIDLWLHNVRNTASWLLSYWGYLGLSLLVAGLICAMIRPKRWVTVLTIAIIGPLAILIVISKNWFPRYFTPIAGPSYIMISWVILRSTEFIRKKLPGTLVQPWQKGVTTMLLTAILIFLCWQPISFDWLILTNPPAAPLPAVDLKQYVQGWPAGYGVPETSDFLLWQANANPDSNIHVIRNYLFDPLFPGLETYLITAPSVELHVLDLSQPDSIGKALELSKLGPTFTVLNQPRVPFSFDEMYGSYARLVAAYSKPGGQSEIQVWRIEQ